MKVLCQIYVLWDTIFHSGLAFSVSQCLWREIFILINSNFSACNCWIKDCIHISLVNFLTIIVQIFHIFTRFFCLLVFVSYWEMLKSSDLILDLPVAPFSSYILRFCFKLNINLGLFYLPVELTLLFLWNILLY